MKLLDLPHGFQTMIDDENVHLGLFATKSEAVAARRAAELDLFGEHCP